jgi:hypothetical protein
MTEYLVLLKDADGYDITAQFVEGLKAAKERAKYLLTDSYAHNIETTHQELNSYKVEVRASSSAECLWDAFRKEN